MATNYVEYQRDVLAPYKWWEYEIILSGFCSTRVNVMAFDPWVFVPRQFRRDGFNNCWRCTGLVGTVDKPSW